MILLDANLDERLAGKFFPGLQAAAIPVRQAARIVQVIDRPVTKTSLLGGKATGEAKRAERRLGELQGAVERLAGSNGLLVAQKAVLAALSHPEGIATAHFGKLRGQDGFKHCDTVVVVGRLEPGPLDVERDARAMFGDEAEPLAIIPPDERGSVRYVQELRCCRMADGTAGPAVRVSVHPDPRAQAILEQTRECEISQAVGRLRLVHRNSPATVFLLTNIPVDLDVTETTTWAALTRDRAAEARQRWGGVWLCSASERSRCAPELWATAEAARQDARRGNAREGSNEGSNPSKIFFEHSDPSFADAASAPPAGDVAVEYRFAGQRGRHPHRAYVPVPAGQRDDAAVRTRLEAITGPVAKLTVHWPGAAAEPETATPTCIPDAPALRSPHVATAAAEISPVERLHPPGTPLFRVLFADVLRAA